MKVRGVIKSLKMDGWIYQKTEGSHRQYEHPEKPAKVTVAGHPSDEVDAGTLRSIRRQAGLSDLGRF